jgi:4-amino-4-deoxy-L-arabinose transferase-like glycosyltransferase
MTRTALRNAVPALALAAAVLVPFLGKAFTIDDTVFLREAQHALSDPLHPTAFEMVWGDVPDRVAPTSGPLMAWLLMPSMLVGGSETVAHLTQLAFLALAVLATVALGLRTGLDHFSAMTAGLLLAATPAALAMTGTAMADVPAMALGVAGLERLVAWKQDRRLHQALVAALLLALAPLARSHLVLLLGVGAILLLPAGLNVSMLRAERGVLWAPLVLAPAVIALVLAVTLDRAAQGADIVTTTNRVSSLDRVAPNLIAYGVHWTLAVPLALPWIALRPSAMLRRLWVFLVAAATAVYFLSLSTPHVFVVAAAAGLGVAVLWDVFAEGWKHRDAVQVALSAWLLVALVAAPYAHLPSKYLLASAPAVALLVAREMAVRRRMVARIVLGATVTLGVMLGIGILRADAAFAGLGRRAAVELIAPNVASGHRVWFAGHWGFQWYAENAGGRILTLTPPYPVAGDLIVTSRNSEPGFAILQMLAERYPTVSHLTRIEDREAGGRIMNARLGAGFFSNGWGYLPWAWGDDPLDTFDLWQIHSDTEAATR